MSTTIILIGLVAIIFVTDFFTKRRFGRLGLALAAGSVLSTIWAYEAELILEALDVAPAGSPTNAIALSAITLLPMVVLLFHGPRYKTLVGRIIGSLLTTVLAMAFLVEPLGRVLAVDGSGADIYSWFTTHKDIVISVGLVLAVGDLLITRSNHSADRRRR